MPSSSVLRLWQTYADFYPNKGLKRTHSRLYKWSNFAKRYYSGLISKMNVTTAFTVNIQNIKQAIAIQATFILEIKLQKYFF